MVEEVTLDSSVLVSAFVKGDKFRPIARRILEKIFSGKYHAVTSPIVFVEVCGAISRRAGMDKAISAKDQLAKWDSMNLITYSELTEKRRKRSVELAIELKLRGMDAMVVQVAEEKGGNLVTFDEEMAEKAGVAVKVLTHKDL